MLVALFGGDIIGGFRRGRGELFCRRRRGGLLRRGFHDDRGGRLVGFQRDDAAFQRGHARIVHDVFSNLDRRFYDSASFGQHVEAQNRKTMTIAAPPQPPIQGDYNQIPLVYQLTRARPEGFFRPSLDDLITACRAFRSPT